MESALQNSQRNSRSVTLEPLGDILAAKPHVGFDLVMRDEIPRDVAVQRLRADSEESSQLFRRQQTLRQCELLNDVVRAVLPSSRI